MKPRALFVPILLAGIATISGCANTMATPHGARGMRHVDSSP